MFQHPAQPPQGPPYVQQSGFPSQQVTAAGMFDQGARFDPNKPVNVPVSINSQKIKRCWSLVTS